MELKNTTALDLQGNVIPNPTAYLYLPGTTTLATGLQDANGNALGNPFTGNANGLISVAAPDGDYDLRVTGAGRDSTLRVRFIDATASVDNMSMADYSALRAYTGGAKRVYITGALVTAKPAGIAGAFQVDATDTTSADNGGTVIVGADGRRWKRDFNGAEIYVDWFGADNSGSTNSHAAISAAISATPTGGTVVLSGFYRSSSSLQITKSMTIAGFDRRVGNVPSFVLSKAFLYFDTDVPVGVDVNGCIVTIDGIAISGIGAGASNGIGVRSRNENNSVILTGGSVVQSFNTGVSMEYGYYNKINTATITFCTNGLVCDNVYNLEANALTISANGSSTQGITLLNGSQMTITGGSIENATLFGIGVLGGSSLVLLGTYFENHGGFNVYLGAGASVTSIGCHVYLTTGANRFISVEDSNATGVRVFSRNNRFIYPTDSTQVTVYQPLLNDATSYWDLAGDNWQSPIGANVTYTPTGWLGLAGNVSIQFPAAHPRYGKNINTVPYGMTAAGSGVAGTPSDGMVVNYGNAGFSGDDPIALRNTAWGYNPYTAVYQKGRWEKVGLRLENQVDSTATTVSGLVSDFNALLSKLRAAGVMI